ncbi:MAG: hypothetical protein KY434_01235 [Actinobacteria bacterium]|nr:hypothetical protein [Actinomycetota bacterium]
MTAPFAATGRRPVRFAAVTSGTGPHPAGDAQSVTCPRPAHKDLPRGAFR